MLILHEFWAFRQGLQRQRFYSDSSPKTQSLLHLWALTLAWVAGSAFPDLPFLLQICCNLVRGYPTETKTSASLELATFILHDWFLWAALLLLAAKCYKHLPTFNRLLVRSFCWGAFLCHIPPDIVSHGRGQGFTGTNYFWPLPEWLARHTGLFLYRQPGKFHLCWEEEILVAIFGVYNTVVLWQRIRELQHSKIRSLAATTAD